MSAYLVHEIVPGESSGVFRDWPEKDKPGSVGFTQLTDPQSVVALPQGTDRAHAAAA